MNRLAGSTWSTPATVAGFARSLPNPALVSLAAAELRANHGIHALDVGCGAGRNAIPIAALGWNVLGIDLSSPMLLTAACRAHTELSAGTLQVALEAMDEIPAAADSFDLVVAHGIWNLAASVAEFRRGLREAARVARPGAGLFVFTFSRNTLPPETQPVPGEAFVFTQFSGQRQCFLTDSQLLAELANVGFFQESGATLIEHNRRRPGALSAGNAPVIYEGVFRYRG